MRPFRRELQIIFQDPFSSLNPRMTAGDIVGEPLRTHRLASGKALRGAGRAIVRPGRAVARADGQLPAPVLRRPAPAHRHRARAGAQSKTDRLRRAGVGARRLDPGAGDQPVDGPAARSRAVLSVHLAQSRGGRAHQPPHRGDVSRPHRRDRRQGHHLHPARPSLYRGAAVGDPGARSRPSATPDPRCRATCRARCIRRAAATSTPAARSRWRAARSRRRCLREIAPGQQVACHLR